MSITSQSMQEHKSSPNASNQYITGSELGDTFRTSSLELLVNQSVLKSLHELLGKSNKVVAIRMLMHINNTPCEVEIGNTRLIGGDLDCGMCMKLTPLFKGKSSYLDALIDTINAPRQQ